jgi:hypothetical protein
MLNISRRIYDEVIVHEEEEGTRKVEDACSIQLVSEEDIVQTEHEFTPAFVVLWQDIGKAANRFILLESV